MNNKSIIIVGCGLFGATCARHLADKGRDVVIIEQHSVVGGNCYDVEQDDILVCKHGAHIFHTNSDVIWQFVNRFASFNNYVHKVLSYVDGKYISFPPNRMTYQQLGIDDRQTIYDKMFDGYTRKQWGKNISPEYRAEVETRIPQRSTFDDRYFTDRYQGMPIGGYTAVIHKMVEGIPVKHRKFTLPDTAKTDTVIYSGSIDELFDYRHGILGYRSLRFEERKDTGDFQGVAVINYPDFRVSYTRSIEHKHFYYQECKNTIVSYEYPCEFDGKNERYYPIADNDNRQLYGKYKAMLPGNMIMGGRLGSYQYLDMDDAIQQAFDIYEKL